MARAPEPIHWWLIALSKTLAWLLAYDQATRTVRAHFHDGPPRPISQPGES